MRSECHRVWCGKQSLALVSALVDFGVKCEHKVMSQKEMRNSTLCIHSN